MSVMPRRRQKQAKAKKKAGSKEQAAKNKKAVTKKVDSKEQAAKNKKVITKEAKKTLSTKAATTKTPKEFQVSKPDQAFDMAARAR